MAYEEDLNRLKEAQRNAAISGLENTRNQALSNLQAERNQNTSMYNQQRSTANAQNRMAARNFQEYLATTGRANSGLGAQARMQNANNLNTNLNYLNAGEASALADINRRTTDAQNAYNTGLAGANAQIEADYIKNLMAEREKQLQREFQERQFQESIRQFNENMTLQRQQLQSRFSSGSGGGGRTSSSSSKSNSSSGRDQVKDGQLYAVDTGTQTIWYQKNPNGKDTVVHSPYAPVSSSSSSKSTKSTKKNTNIFSNIKGMLSFKK